MPNAVGLPRFTGILGSGFDAVSREILFAFQGEDGRRYQMRLPGAILGPLHLQLLAREHELAEAMADREIEISPLTLEDATAISLEDGQVGLLIQLERNLRVALLPTAKGKAALRAALAEYEQLATPPGPSRPLN